MENTDSKTERIKPLSIGQEIAKMIDREKWNPFKIAIIIIILALPFGPLALACYIGGRELARKKRKQNV